MKLSYVCVSVYVFDCLYSPGLCFGCLEPEKGNALHNSRDLLNINPPDSCNLARPLPCKVMLSISFQLSQHSFDLISSPFAIRVNSFNSVFLLFIYLFIYLLPPFGTNLIKLALQECQYLFPPIEVRRIIVFQPRTVAVLTD